MDLGIQETAEKSLATVYKDIEYFYEQTSENIETIKETKNCVGVLKRVGKQKKRG